MQTCAVIGGTGFIGRHLVKALVAERREVIVISRSLPADRDARVRYAQADMRDEAALGRALAGADTVLHLGATIPNAFVRASAIVREGNEKGAASVVAACRAAGARNLAYVTGHLGPPPGHAPDEVAFTHAKVAAEEIVLAANGRDGLAACSVRAPVIFGPGDKITSAFLRGDAPAFPGIPTPFDFMYVGDLVPIVIRAAERLDARDARVAGQAVDVPGERMTFPAFFALPAWGRPPPRFVPFRAVRALAALNAWCARAIGKAPLGAELCPEVLDEMAIHHRKEGGRPAAEALDLAGLPRSVEAGIRTYLAQPAE